MQTTTTYTIYIHNRSTIWMHKIIVLSEKIILCDLLNRDTIHCNSVLNVLSTGKLKHNKVFTAQFFIDMMIRFH